LTILLMTITIILIVQTKSTKLNNKIYTYQVRELERNSVFNITDTVGGYTPLDTAWVNMEKLMIDPTDNQTMMCVIIKEIK